MNIAELFVSLGIKSTDKTVRELSNVTKGLGEAKSMSIEAKAGILAVMYGLEQMMAQSGRVGTSLTNFGALTGVNTKELQQWEYALKMAGGTAAEMDETVKNIQKSMAAVDLNKGLPEGLQLLSQAVKAAGGMNGDKMGIDFSKKDDPFYMLRAYEKGMKQLGDSPRAKAVGNYLMSTVHVGENVVAGMRRNKFDQKILDKAPYYTDKQLGGLDRGHMAWVKIGDQIERAFGKFTAEKGEGLVKNLVPLVDKVLALANALVTLSEKVHVFEMIGKALQGWTFIADGVSSAAGDVANDKKGVLHGLYKVAQKAATTELEVAHGALLTVADSLKDQHQVAPKISRPHPQAHNTTINQKITHNGDAKDTHAVKRLHKSGVEHSFWQRPIHKGS